jgi:hypothetical protein
MARETREVWAGRIARWQQSGLTAERFAGREGVNPRTLTFWKWKLGHDDHHAAEAATSSRRGGERLAFVEVPQRAAAPAAMAAPSAALEVVAGGYRVGVAPGFDAATLRALLDVIEGRR